MKQPRPVKYKKPRKKEEGRVCRICGRPEGVIRKYGINMCRQCFKRKAKEMGFEKYN